MAKRTLKEYRSDLSKAYSEGYRAGYNAKIADLKGARLNAKRGYRKGVSSRKAHDMRMK